MIYFFSFSLLFIAPTKFLRFRYVSVGTFVLLVLFLIRKSQKSLRFIRFTFHSLESCYIIYSSNKVVKFPLRFSRYVCYACSFLNNEISKVATFHSFDVSFIRNLLHFNRYVCYVYFFS